MKKKSGAKKSRGRPATEQIVQEERYNEVRKQPTRSRTRSHPCLKILAAGEVYSKG